MQLSLTIPTGDHARNDQKSDGLATGWQMTQNPKMLRETSKDVLTSPDVQGLISAGALGHIFAGMQLIAFNTAKTGTGRAMVTR